MKKLLVTLLSVLMIISIGVANVAADEENLVGKPLKPGFKDVEIGILLSEGGLNHDGDATRVFKDEGVVKAKVKLHSNKNGIVGTFYYLDELVDEVNDFIKANDDYKGYKFLMFSSHYNFAKKEATSWKAVGNDGREYRYAGSESECYAVLVDTSHIDDIGFIINKNLVFNGTKQSPFVETPHIEGAEIFYQKENGHWTKEVPTFRDAGEYTITYMIARPKHQPYIKKAKFEIKKFELTEENTQITFNGPTKDGEKVSYDVKVDLMGDGNYKILWSTAYGVNGTDTPKNFGENTLSVVGKGNNYCGTVEAIYNVGHVADQYVEWNQNNKYYRFDAQYHSLTNTYTVKTTEGFTATAVAIEIGKNNFVVFTGKLVGDLFDYHKVSKNPAVEATFEYKFMLGNHGSLVDRIEFGNNLPIESAKLHVFNKDLETGEVDSVNGDFVYYEDENSIVDGEGGKYVSVVVPLGKDYENAGIDEQMKKNGLAKTSSYDIYVLFFADGEKEGVRVEPAEGNKVTVTLDSPYIGLEKAPSKHTRSFIAVHEKAENSYELLNVSIDGDEAKVTADHFSVFSFGYKDVKIPSNKKNRKYEPVKTSVED